MIRIGIIGLGWWGKQIVTCLAESPCFRVVAGCDIDTEMAAPFVATHKLDLIDDYRNLIRRTDLEAVAVVTPHLLHEEMAIAALEAGKQVFCEKPLALTVASAERILAASKKAGGVLGIGHERRYEPAMEEMRRLFDSGALGRVLHMDANVSHNNFRKMDPSNWRRDARHAPAGAWTALGIYLGDMFVSLAGKPVRVVARTTSQIFPTPSEDFGTHEVFRRRRKNLRRRAGHDADRFAGKRDEHVAKMNSERRPGAGWSVTGVATPVRRIHFSEIVVTYIGVHVQYAPECSAVEQTAHFFHRGFVSSLMADTKYAARLFACRQNPLRTGRCKRERFLTKNLLAGFERSDRHFFVQKVRGYDRNRIEVGAPIRLL